MADNKFKHWAFISYSLTDNGEDGGDTPVAGSRCWANWLRDALKTYSIPPEFVGHVNGRGEIIPERIEPVFQDGSALPENAGLSEEIRQALEQSGCLVVICSPRSAQSRQVNEVVRHFKQLGRSQSVFPIVVAGQPNAGHGNPPGVSPAEECFVPALRHPVLPDGTLDTTRPSAKFVYIDARYGVEKREILANDDRLAEAELEMAKVQLIALVLGVGFHGLWTREQKRHFLDLTEARQQVGAALHQVAEARRELEAARQENRVPQNPVPEPADAPRDFHDQIQAAQHLAEEARNQAREARQQLEEFQAKVRETETQLEDARQRALAAESKIQAMLQEAQEVQAQFESTRQQLNALRDAQNQPEELRQQAQADHEKFLAAQSRIQELQNQVQSAQSVLEEARTQVREAQAKVLEAQNEARAAQEQVRETQDRAVEAQKQSEELRQQAQVNQDIFLVAQSRIQELQDQAQSAQTQLEEARQRALAAESRVQGMLQQAQEAQAQFEAAPDQLHASPDAQSQTEELRQQRQADHDKFTAAQSRIQELQDQAQSAQDQLEEARQRALAAETKVQGMLQQAQEVQAQFEETRQQLDAARDTQSQSEELRQQAQTNHDKFLAAQNWIQELQSQTQSAQSQLEEARGQVREAQAKVLVAQQEASAAQERVRETENRTGEAQGQIEAARIQLQNLQDQNRNARRRTRVYALLAVLASVAACTVATQALRERQAASLALEKAMAERSGNFDLASLGSEPITQVLQTIGGAEQVENRRRSLDQMAAGVPRPEISDALAAAAVIADDQERSHFQKWLLIRLGWVNPASAMTHASAIAGRIVDDAGQPDSNVYFQLAVLDNWMQIDSSGAFHWVCQLPDGEAHQRALNKIIQWWQSQPESDAKNKALIYCMDELGKTDIPAAFALAESLPATAGRGQAIASLWLKADPFAATDLMNNLSPPPAIMSSPHTSWPFPASPEYWQ